MGQLFESITVEKDALIHCALQAKQQEVVVDSSDARVCTSDDYGKLIILTHADTVAVTLPANGAPAGSYIDFLWDGNDSLAVTISAAVADTLRAPNDATADSITFASGHRIGAYVRFISDGSYWNVVNLGSTTMTVAT